MSYPAIGYRIATALRLSRTIRSCLQLSWLCFYVILCCDVQGREESGPNIAVIGAGIGGSAFSQYARELLPHGTNITVYEAATEPGGRISSFSFADGNNTDSHNPKTYEIERGASVIYTGNMLVQEAVSKFQLKTYNSFSNHTMRIWDGQEFVARPDGFFNVFRAVWRWGFFKPFYAWRAIYKTLNKFMCIYDKFEKGETYSTGDDLWEALGLTELIQTNISQALGESRFLDEFVAFATGTNYNQGNGINGLAGFIAMCPAVTGDLFKIVGGNKQLTSALLKASGATVKLGVKVTSVVKVNSSEATSPRYVLYAGDKRLDDEEYDIVILAAPFSQASISFYLTGSGRTLPHIDKQMFQTTHATFVVGKVKPEAFGLRADEPLPHNVVLTKDGREKEIWSKIGIEEELENGRAVYKLFSSSELSSGALDIIFGKGEYSVVNHKEWAAYPKLDPLVTWSSCGGSTSPPCYPFLPFSGHSIFYLNALEMAVSAIEVSMVSAKNAALLLKKNWNSITHTMDVGTVAGKIVNDEPTVVGESGEL